MKRLGWLYGALLALALAAGLAGGSSGADSPVPSARNPGPRGVKLLATWLEATGAEVRLVDEPLTDLPPGIATLVLAAPNGHGASAEERDAIERFVRAGGTLVYLAPRRSPLQRELETWLDAVEGKAPPRDAASTAPEDLLGFSDPVTLAGRALGDVKALRLRWDDGVEVGAPGAVPVTKARMLWWWPLGKGEVWVGAGPDLAEAARLELEDNLTFWAALARRGPIAFDEYHQAPKPPPALSANLAASLGQLAFCALAFVLCFAVRLGPARATPVVQHRSSLEYVDSLAGLTRSARVEPELAAEACARLQRVLDVPDGALPVSAHGVHTPHDFLELSRRCAELEAKARGRT